MASLPHSKKSKKQDYSSTHVSNGTRNPTDTTNGFLNPTAIATNKAQRHWQRRQEEADEGGDQSQPNDGGDRYHLASNGVVALASGTGSTSSASGGTSSSDVSLLDGQRTESSPSEAAAGGEGADDKDDGHGHQAQQRKRKQQRLGHLEHSNGIASSGTSLRGPNGTAGAGGGAPAPILPLQQHQPQLQPVSHLIPASSLFPSGVLALDPALAASAAAAAAVAAAMRISATAAAAPFMGVHNLIPAPGGGHHVHPHSHAHAHAHAQAARHAAVAMHMQAHLGGGDGAQQEGGGGGINNGNHYHNHDMTTHNLIPGGTYVPPVYASAQPQQQQQPQQPHPRPGSAQAAGPLAVAVAHHHQQPYPAPAQQQQQLYHQQQQQQQQQQHHQQQPNLIAADHRVSPLSFYGPAAAAPGGSMLPKPMSWIASQHPLVPIPPNVPGLPYYGLPPDPTTGKPYQTVQDMISSLGHGNIIPTYNGINTSYPGVRMLSNPDTGLMGGAGSTVPPIYAVDNFLTPSECDYLIAAAGESFTPAPVVGRGAGEVSVSRTSSTVYLAREDLPLYLEKVCRLVGKPREHCELPQVGRYFPSQQYMQHFDAFDLSNEDGQRFASNGGQRTVTVLVYLNDVAEGGSTSFPALNLDVRPRKGMALVFFPATTDGLLDKNTLHAALPAVDTKYVSQVWIRQGNYDGLPTKRIFANEEIARKAAQTYCCSSNPLASGIEGMLTMQQQQRLQLPAQQP